MNVPRKIALALGLILAAAAVFVFGCGDGSKNSPEKDKIYDIQGKVTRVDIEKKKVKIDHQDIPGLMKGMEMEFDVDDVGVLEGIKVGDQVQGRLKVASGRYTITELHKE